jgi:tRNA (guanosine-2'-O-)-methyltransferase
MIQTVPVFDEQYLHFLMEMITEERLRKFNEVLNNRTRFLTIVLEDIFQTQNASAVLRSCDLTGIQDVHIIENKYNFEIHPDIVLGSTKWLDIYRYNEQENNTHFALNHLKAAGYKLVATSPKPGGYLLHELPIDKPLALMFGTERRGLSGLALDMADYSVTIPMVGFTESFNISVSAALVLFNLSSRLRDSELPWMLTEIDRNSIMLDWCRKSLKQIKIIERNYFKQHPQ